MIARAPRLAGAEVAGVGTGDHTRHLIGLRLLPFLFILYITNYLDRTSEAYAALEISPDDLGLSRRA